MKFENIKLNDNSLNEKLEFISNAIYSKFDTYLYRVGEKENLSVGFIIINKDENDIVKDISELKNLLKKYGKINHGIVCKTAGELKEKYTDNYAVDNAINISKKN